MMMPRCRCSRALNHSHSRRMMNLLNKLFIAMDHLFMLNITMNDRSDLLNDLMSGCHVVMSSCIGEDIVGFGGGDVALSGEMRAVVFHLSSGSSIAFVFFNDFNVFASIILLMVSRNPFINRLNDLLNLNSLMLTFNTRMNNLSNMLVMMFNNNRLLNDSFNNNTRSMHHMSMMFRRMLAFLPSGFLVT